jgi:hypothetical protein
LPPGELRSPGGTDAKFTVKQLSKTDSSITRSPNFHKYYIHCSGRITSKTPTTEPWLRILKLIKTDISDIDKSRILLGYLEKYSEVVVKIGDSKSIQKEYEYNTYIHSLKGFIKYICYFSCNDDYLSIPSDSRSTLCKGPGSSMGVIIMPYFPLGSIAKYPWNKSNMLNFHSCLKQAFLSIVILFLKKNIIHGDFHPGNVLLKTTKQSEVSYSIEELGNFNIKTYGLRTWIMDFENTHYAIFSSKTEVIKTFNNFYFDIQKFFSLLYNTIKILDLRTINPIVNYISNMGIDSKYLNKENIDTIFNMIDKINVMPTEL